MLCVSAQPQLHVVTGAMLSSKVQELLQLQWHMSTNLRVLYFSVFVHGSTQLW